MVIAHKNGQFIIKGVFALFLLLSLFSAISLPALAVANQTTASLALAQEDANNFLTNTALEAKLSQPKSATPSAYQIIGKIINWILSFVGIVFLILIIYGGLDWMTASGNEEKISKATTIFKQALLGLVVVIVAFLLTNFVVFKLLEIFANK